MDATTILQDYVDRISAAALSGDWPTYRAGVSLPFNLITHAANINITTEADLREGFNAFHKSMKSQHVTAYIRLVQSAAFLDTNLISGGYITHLMSGGTRIVPPYTSHMALRKSDECWCAVSITNALTHTRWRLLIPSVIDRPSSKGTDQ